MAPRSYVARMSIGITIGRRIHEPITIMGRDPGACEIMGALLTRQRVEFVRWLSGSPVYPPSPYQSPNSSKESGASSNKRVDENEMFRKAPSRGPSSRPSLADELDYMLSKSRRGVNDRRGGPPKSKDSLRRPFAPMKATSWTNFNQPNVKGEGNGLNSQPSSPSIGRSDSLSPLTNSSSITDTNGKLDMPDADGQERETPTLDDIFGIPSRPLIHLPSERKNETSDYDHFLEMLNKFREDYLSKSWKRKLKGKDLEAVEEYLKRQEPVVTVDYPELDQALAVLRSSDTITSTDSDAKKLKNGLTERVKEQKLIFMRKMKFDDDQYRTVARCLLFMGGICAKYSKSGLVNLIWQKALEAGFAEPALLHALVHVSSTAVIEKNRNKRTVAMPSILDVLRGADMFHDKASDASMNDGEAREIEEMDGHDKAEEIATFHDLLYKPTEQTIHSRIRMLVSRGEGKAAERLLHGSEVKLHLRAYTPIFTLLLEKGEFGSALSLYRRMREIDSVIFDSDTFVQLLASLAEHGRFNADASPIDAEFGYSLSGPALFDKLAGEMSEEIIDIAPNSARRIYNGLAKGFPKDSGLKPVGALESLALNNTPAPKDSTVIASRVQVDQQTGICPRTGVKLHLKHLTDAQKESLKQGCRTLALERQSSWNYRGRELADENLDEFLEWMDKREGEPYTAIVDGANVGYYMQNFDNGGFNFYQIEFVVRSLEAKGENPLVILPQKYTRNIFLGSTNQRKQVLTMDDRRILQDLKNAGKLFVVESGLLDDFYWILASVAKQTVSSAGRDITVPVGDPKRWPGMRPVLITNDQVRDHKLGMLEPMPFKRWNSNVVVNYNFAAFVGDQCSHPGIGFSPIAFFSREIQRNLDERGAAVWHFPLSDSADEWFCVRL